MMEKFIYVFDIDARDILLMCGYKLFKSDDKNRIYVFYNNGQLSFSEADTGKDISFALSNTISF